MTDNDSKHPERQWVAQGEPGFPPYIAPFSLGVRTGQMVFTAGQAAVDEKGNIVGIGDVAAQTQKTLENIGAILERLGASFRDVVKVTIWLSHFRDYAAMNEVYARFFPEPRPVRACVRADLAFPELLVEIEATAIVGSGADTATP